jgi:hypothetical protein
MIAANELRIGNWVKLEHVTFSYNKVTSINKIGIIVDEHIHTTLSIVYGITLTSEILEKCGFERLDGWKDNWWFNGIVGINYHLGKLYYNTNLNDSVYIQHLHQLQNLYFALTGEELNYTP